MKRTISILAIVTILLLSTLACRTLSILPSTNNRQAEASPIATMVAQPPSNPALQPVPVDLISSQDTLIQLYQRVNPGVVALRVLTTEGGAQGSGFVIDKEGHIITNYHVVESEKELEVAFPSGLKVRGEVIGTDLDSDLAVIKVDAPQEELSPLTLGDSDQVKTGQMVVAIGNPFGLEGTMTTGIVSGLGRTIRSLHTTTSGGSFTVGDVIQTDAAINPGNSGGPLLNLNGEVVGVNESIITNNSSPVNSGVGFAISINIVKRVISSLIEKGKYDYPYLGIVSANDLTLLQQEALGLPRSTGVYVTSVSPGGPAEKAGVRGGTADSNITGLPKGGDLIIAIDGKPVVTFNDLIGYLVKQKKPGDTVVLTVLRDGKELQLSLTLDKRPSS